MTDNVIERLRKTVVKGLFSTQTVKRVWPTWKGIINSFLGDNPSPQRILGLAENLRVIFKSTGSEGRGQSQLSGGGSAWESLITWYINLCCAGSRVVAVKKIGDVPTPIRDAITVIYSNYPCSSESDITVIIFPDDEIFTGNPSQFLSPKAKNVQMNILSDAVDNKFRHFGLGVIQCKTNWNDNAQIPMLWDMIYGVGRTTTAHLTVGKNMHLIDALNTFSYAFITVPTNQLTNYKESSVCVQRVNHLSGGNYWGLQSKNGIARSINEIFSNYIRGFEHGDITRTLESVPSQLHTDLDYFNL